MTIQEAIIQRHSVRRYTDDPLTEGQVKMLSDEIAKYNDLAGLHMQLVQNEPKALGSFLTSYGRFSGVKNYIALIGPKDDEQLKEKFGYYGEKLVLSAQMMGLNTCWVATSYSQKKKAVSLSKEEVYVGVITIGVGMNKGYQHVSKAVDRFSEDVYFAPEWFRRGIECAMLAPTALNRQNFRFTFDDKTSKVSISNIEQNQYSGFDLGIAKLHFELGSGKTPSIWL